jgi:hypothetical protein
MHMQIGDGLSQIGDGGVGKDGVSQIRHGGADRRSAAQIT